MSERQEHKRRYNQRLQYIAEVYKWLETEPPIYMYLKWKKWQKRRPTWNDIEAEKDEAAAQAQIGQRS